MSMEEGDALDFYEDVVGNEEQSDHVVDKGEEYVLEAKNNRELTVELVPLDRKFVIDKLNKLPDELLEVLDEADDADEATEEASASDALGGLSGAAIEAFEELCAESMEHGELTQHHFDKMATELGLEILFDIGARVIEMSLEDDGRIEGFRKRD